MIPADKAFTKYIEKYQNLNFKIYMLSFLLLYCWKQNVNKNDFEKNKFETFFSGTSQFFFKCHFLYLFCLYNAAFLNFMQKKWYFGCFHRFKIWFLNNKKGLQTVSKPMGFLKEKILNLHIMYSLVLFLSSVLISPIKGISLQRIMQLLTIYQGVHITYFKIKSLVYSRRWFYG